MKKLSLILVTLAITMLATVPVFAGPLEEVAAARAEQEKRLCDYLAYQQRLAEFQASEIAKGQAALAAGKAAEQANFARIAAFQASQIAQGQAALAAGRAAEQANFARIAAFQASQIAQAQANLAAGRAAEAANFARIRAFQESQLAIAKARAAKRAEIEKAVREYLALF